MVCLPDPRRRARENTGLSLFIGQRLTFEELDLFSLQKDIKNWSIIIHVFLY